MNRANQRKLASLYSAGDISSDLAKYNQFKVQWSVRLGLNPIEKMRLGLEPIRE